MALALDGLGIEDLRALLVWGPSRIHDMKPPSSSLAALALYWGSLNPRSLVMEFATPVFRREWENAMSVSSQQRSARRTPAASKASQIQDPNEIDVSWCSATGNWWRKIVVLWCHKVDSRKLKTCVFMKSVSEGTVNMATWEKVAAFALCRSTFFRSIPKFCCLACIHVDGFVIFAEHRHGWTLALQLFRSRAKPIGFTKSCGDDIPILLLPLLIASDGIFLMMVGAYVRPPATENDDPGSSNEIYRRSVYLPVYIHIYIHAYYILLHVILYTAYISNIW